MAQYDGERNPTETFPMRRLYYAIQLLHDTPTTLLTIAHRFDSRAARDQFVTAGHTHVTDDHRLAARHQDIPRRKRQSCTWPLILGHKTIEPDVAGVPTTCPRCVRLQTAIGQVVYRPVRVNGIDLANPEEAERRIAHEIGLGRNWVEICQEVCMEETVIGVWSECTPAHEFLWLRRGDLRDTRNLMRALFGERQQHWAICVGSRPLAAPKGGWLSPDADEDECWWIAFKLEEDALTYLLERWLGEQRSW